MIPKDTRIRFIQSAADTVHILPPVDWLRESTRITDGDQFADAVMSRTRMLCGARLFVDRAGGSTTGRAAKPVGCFEDDALCQRCMRAMGEDAYRVFEQRLYEEIARAADSKAGAR